MWLLLRRSSMSISPPVGHLYFSLSKGMSHTAGHAPLAPCSRTLTSKRPGLNDFFLCVHIPAVRNGAGSLMVSLFTMPLRISLPSRNPSRRSSADWVFCQSGSPRGMRLHTVVSSSSLLNSSAHTSCHFGDSSAETAIADAMIDRAAISSFLMDEFDGRRLAPSGRGYVAWIRFCNIN